MLRAKGGFRWAKVHNSRFETSKSVLVNFSWSKSVKWPPPMLWGSTIMPSSTHKFIGVMVDQELHWQQQALADYATAKATKWTLAFRRLAHTSMGIKPWLMQQMYLAVAVPKMSYAADVWYMPIYEREGRARCSGSVGFTGRLIMLQGLVATAITGTLHSTATDMLDLHANLLPVDLLLHKICHRAAVRLTTLPASHPLAARFQLRARKFIKLHRSALHELAFIFSINPSVVETLSPVRLPPRHQTGHRVVPFRLAEDSIERDRGDTAEIRIYTDGSGFNGQAGAAAMLYCRGEVPISLRCCLGSLDEHTSFEAEVAGLILGTHLLGQEPQLSTVTINTDSKAALLGLDICTPKPSQ